MLEHREEHRQPERLVFSKFYDSQKCRAGQVSSKCCSLIQKWVDLNSATFHAETSSTITLFHFITNQLLIPQINPYPTGQSKIDDYPSMILTSCNSLILYQICTILLSKEAGKTHHSFAKDRSILASFKEK